MKLIEWEVSEDSYQEQILIPKKIRDLAKQEGISTKIKSKVSASVLNMNTGESYSARLAITGNYQLYLPVGIQKMLKGAGTIRIRLC